MSMHSVKGQLTIFMILGLILLFGAGFFLLTTRNTAEETITAPQDDAQMQIRNSLSSCLESAAMRGAERLAYNGGYFDVPEVIAFEGTAYWYFEGRNIQPSFEEVTQRLKDYFFLEAKNCQNLSYFEEKGYTLSFNRNMTLNLTVEKGLFRIDADFLLTGGKGSETLRIDGARFVVKNRFYDLFFAAKDMLNWQSQPGVDPSSNYRPEGLDARIRISIQKRNPKDLLIVISDETSKPALKLRLAKKLS